VTSRPGVECDLCGRSLLRGERPEVFLGGGQHHTVCELCSTRAAQEGWRRAGEQDEVERPATGWRARRPQRGRALLGRLGWPGAERTARPARAARGEPVDDDERGAAAAEWDGVESEWADATHTWPAADGDISPEHFSPDHASPERVPQEWDAARDGLALDASGDLVRALEVFNASEHPRRVAGVARALGPACVKVAPLAGASETIAIVASWELCWYRYEVDLGDEPAGAPLAAEGMDPEELPAADRVANAAADERGELSLLPAH